MVPFAYLEKAAPFVLEAILAPRLNLSKGHLHQRLTCDFDIHDRLATATVIATAIAFELTVEVRC